MNYSRGVQELGGSRQQQGGSDQYGVRAARAAQQQRDGKSSNRQAKLQPSLFGVEVIDNSYSWGHLVVPNTEELISRPFLDENSIRQLF